MKLEKQNLDNKPKLTKKVKQVKKSNNSNIKWWTKEFVLPIAKILIPLLIVTGNTEQPPNPVQPTNPPIERTTTPPSK
ncbi:MULTISPECIES: hypothetical protein [unclassified Microcoleus]|uniref:hypothetical protein n=1 Tax=unclassified Microcoleus TaxID=2642155 RepID=UPI0025D1B2A4|nr:MULTISPECIES: hypothetical protein [unclassified Microcoleus]